MAWARNILIGGGIGLGMYMWSLHDDHPETPAPSHRPSPAHSTPATPHPSARGSGELGMLSPAETSARFAGTVVLTEAMVIPPQPDMGVSGELGAVVVGFTHN